MATPDSVLGIQLTLDDQATRPLKSFESAVIRTVGAVSAALAAIAAIGFPVASAVEYQKQLLSVRKTTGMAHEDIAILSKDLIELSRQTNQSAVNLAKMAEMGGRMGMADKGTAQLTEFVKQVATLATALDMEAEEVSMGMGKITNLFNLQMDEFAKAGAVINQMDNESTANAEQLFDIIRRTGSLGGSVSLAQSAALASIAIDLGMTAETAGTTYTKIFADMKAQASDFAAFMGITTGQWVAALEQDGVAALVSFLKQLNKMPSEVAAATKATLTGEGRIFEFVTKLQKQVAQGQGSLFSTRLNSAAEEWERGTSALEEQQTVLSGVSAQWEVFKNKLNAVAISVGEKTLYSITRALIALGDALSSPEVIEQFTRAMVSLVENITAFIRLMGRLTSGLTMPWESLLNIAGMMLAVKALGLLRNALLSIPAKVASVQGVPVKEGVKATGTGQEASALGVLTNARRAYTAQQERSNALQQEALRAQREAVLAERALVTAVQARNEAALRLKNNTRIQTNAANAVAVAQNAPDIYLTQRTTAALAAHNQQLAQMETAYQAQRKAITGKGSVALRAELKAQYDLEVAAAEKRHAAVLRGYQLHYNNLKGISVLNTDAALARLGNANASVDRSKVALSSAKQGIFDAALIRRNAREAAEAASEALERSTLTGKVKGFGKDFAKAFREGGDTAAANLLHNFNKASQNFQNSSGGFARAGLLMGSTLRLIGIGAGQAAASIGLLARGLNIVASVGMRLLGWVGIAIIIYDIGKAILEMTGLLTPLVNGINKAIDALNRLTGLSIPKFSTEEETAKLEADNAAKVKAIEEAALAAEGFGRAYGRMDFSQSEESFDAHLAAVRSKMRKEQEELNKGIKFDLFKNTKATDVMQGGLASAALINKEYAYTVSLLELERSKLSGNAKALVEQEQTLARMRKERAAFDKETSTYSGLATRGNAAVVERRNQESLAMVEQERAVVSEIVALKKEQETSQTRILNLDKAQVALMSELDETIQGAVSGLDKNAFAELFGSGAEQDALIARLQKAQAMVDSLQAKYEAAGAKVGQVGAAKETGREADAAREDYARIADSLRVAKENYAALSKEAVGTQTIVRAASAEERAGLVSRIANLGTYRQIMTSLQRTAKATGTDVQSLFKGLASMSSVGTATYAGALGQVLLAQSAKKAYSQMAATAKAAAEEAKNAVTKALTRAKQDLQGLYESSIQMEQALRRNRDQAAATKAGRGVDQDTAKKLLELDLEKRKEMAILDTLQQQNAISEEMYARRKLDIDQDYDRKSVQITDTAADTKNKTLAQQQLKLFAEAQAKAVETKKILDGLAKQMADSSLPPEVRSALLEPFEDTMTQLDTYVKAMASAKDTILGISTSTGLPAVPVGRLEEMQRAIEEQTKARNATNIAAAGSQESVLKNIESQLNQGTRAAEALEKEGVKALQAIAAESGKSMTKVGEDLAKLADSEAFTKMQQQFDELAAKGAIAVGSVGFNMDDFNRVIESARTEADAAFKDLSVTVDTKPLSEQLKAVAETFRKQLQEGADPEGQGEAAAAKAKITIEPTIAKEAMASAVASLGEVPIEATAYITKVVNADGSEERTSVKVPHLRDGGPIIGAGSGRSDEVPIMAAHGEYMIDALTTRTFGNGFFRTLQSIAKSGRSGDLLMQHFPGLAQASALSPVGAVASVMGSGEGEGASTQILDISFNKRKVGKVAGSRDTLNTLVSALQEVARGT